MKRQLAALSANHVSGHGQSQPRSSGIGIARALEAQEGTENLFTLIGRYSRPIIIDQYLDALAAPVSGHGHVLPEAPGVGQEIRKSAMQRLGPQHRDEVAVEMQIHPTAGPPRGARASAQQTR